MPIKPGVLIGDDRPRSEADAWLIVRDHARFIQQHTRGEVKSHAELIEVLCDGMIAQLRRGVHVNPDLAVVSLGAMMNPPPGGEFRGVSPEKHAAQVAGKLLSFFSQTADPVRASIRYADVAARESPAHERAHWGRVKRVLESGGAVAGNPSGEVFGSDVLAIVYQHNEDRPGDVRVHTFGGKQEAKWRETARGVEVYDLPRTTGVYMSAEGDKRVVMQHRRGLPLVQEF